VGVDLGLTDRPITPLERGAPRPCLRLSRSPGRQCDDTIRVDLISSQTGCSGAPEPTEDQPLSGGSQQAHSTSLVL
jgi:hypothetical protein